MLRSQDRSYTRLDTWLLIGSLALGVVGLVLPGAWSYELAGALRRTAFLPLVWLQERAEEGKTSRSRFQLVTAQRDSAALKAQALPILRAENSRLRQLLGLAQRLGTPYVAAEIMHQSVATDGRVLLLNVGRANGVQAFDPIVAPEGLIGVVTNVSGRSSIGMTWAHPEFRVSAYTADGSAFGIVAPAPNGTASEAALELRGVPYRDSVPNGSPVLSSGLGGVYPKGIPLGTVVGVSSEQRGWERVYRLRPAANPSMVAHVLVLTSPRDTTVVDAFPSDSILRAVAADSVRRAAQADSALRVRIADSVKAAVRDSVARAAAQRADSARQRGDTGRATPRAAAPARAVPNPAAPPRPAPGQAAPKPAAPRAAAPVPVRRDTSAAGRRDSTVRRAPVVRAPTVRRDSAAARRDSAAARPPRPAARPPARDTTR